MSLTHHTLDPDGDVFLILADRDKDSGSNHACMDDENDNSPGEIRVQCSSKHLSLASEVFKAMLSQNFKEGVVLRSKRTLKLPLPDDDPGALLILLNIIHGQTKEVPREVDLHMLARIAILVDKYRLQMVVGILSHIWVDLLKEDIPGGWTEDLRRWMFISWVFRCSEEFEDATWVAEYESESRIDESGEIDLPIPQILVDTIDQSRQTALSGIITGLHRVLEKYRGPEMICTLRCDSMVLGSLTKVMRDLELLTPPEAPYSKLSFDGLATSIQSKKEMILTDSHCTYGNKCLNLSYEHGVKQAIEKLIQKLRQGLRGLSLEFVDNQKQS